MPDYFRLPCPNCSHPLRIRQEYVGLRIACKECHHSFVMKAPAPEELPRGAATVTETFDLPLLPSQPDSSTHADRERLESEVASLHEEAMQLRTQLDQARVELANAREQAEQAPETTPGDVERLENELASLRESSEELQSELAKKQAESATVREEIETFLTEFGASAKPSRESRRRETRHSRDWRAAGNSSNGSTPGRGTSRKPCGPSRRHPPPARGRTGTGSERGRPPADGVGGGQGRMGSQAHGDRESSKRSTRGSRTLPQGSRGGASRL